MSEQVMFVHKVCKSQLVRVQGEPPFCEVCDRSVGPTRSKRSKTARARSPARTIPR